MSDNPYQPIPCALHESYELAVLRRVAIDLSWRSADNFIQRARLVPEDVFTREGAEYLLAIALDGDRHLIRLDRILNAVWAATGEVLPGLASEI
jgi:Rho-binding antiterminator